MAWSISWEDLNPAAPSGSGTTITLTRSVTAGEVVFLGVIGGGSGALASVSIADSAGNTWTITNTITNGFFITASAWAVMTTTGSLTITVTYRDGASAPLTTTQRGVKALGLNGIDTASPVNGTPNAQFQSGIGAGTDNLSSNTITATADGVTVGFCVNIGDNINPAAGTGFTSTRVDWTAQFGGARIEYKTVANGGAAAALYSAPGPSSPYSTHAIAFKDAAAAASPVLKRRVLASWDAEEPPAYRRRPRLAVDGTVVASSVLRRRLAADWPEEPPPPQPRRRPRPIGVGESAGLPAVPGLQLWLRGDLGVVISGGAVQGWKDSSGHTNNDTASFLATMPVSSINGRQGFRFTGTEHFDGGSNILSSGSPRTIFVVAQTSGSGGPLLSIRTSAVADTYFSNQAGYASFPSGVFTDSIDGTRNATATPPTTSPHIFQYTAAAAPAFLAMKVDGVTRALSQSNPCQAETGTTGFTVGSWPAGGGAPGWVGDICEVLVYDSVLSAGDEAAIQDYLAVRYAIATSDVLLPRRRVWGWPEAVDDSTFVRRRLVTPGGAVAADAVLKRRRLYPLFVEEEIWQRRAPELPLTGVVAADFVLVRRRRYPLEEEPWDGRRRRLPVFPYIVPPDTGVRPPLVAKVDDIEQMCGNSQLGNAMAAGDVDLTLEGDR